MPTRGLNPLSVPAAAYLVVDCYNYTRSYQGWENIDMSRYFGQCHYYVAKEIFNYSPQERSYYSQDQDQPEVAYKITLVSKVQHQSAGKTNYYVYQRSVCKIVI